MNSVVEERGQQTNVQGSEAGGRLRDSNENIDVSGRLQHLSENVDVGG
jgi:hypothetical protein